MKAFTRDAPRCNAFVRQWRVLVLLRTGPWTLSELSLQLGCVERTVRRDIEALKAVPFPIRKVGDGRGDLPSIWHLGPFAGWPRHAETPTRDLDAVEPR